MMKRAEESPVGLPVLAACQAAARLERAYVQLPGFDPMD